MGISVHICNAYLSGTESPLLWFWAAVRKVLNLNHIDWLKIYFQLGSKSFDKSCSKKFELSIFGAIPIQRYENMSGYDTGTINISIIRNIIINPLMPGGNKKVTHT